MVNELYNIIEDEGKDNTLFLFYADLLDGNSDPSDSKIIQILKDDFKFENLLRNFNLMEQLKIRNIKNEIDRDVKIVNMLILKFIINEYESERNEKLAELIIKKNEFGKPKLYNRDYEFNISDEFGMVSLAIGFNKKLKDYNIGIDLANPKDIENFKLDKLENFYKRDFKSIFNNDEIIQLDKYFNDLDYNDRLNKLSQIWSLKESYCKYKGIGITAGMENFPFVDNIKLQNLSKDPVNKTFDKFIIKNENIKMNKIEGYEALNASFKMPESSLLCSVFGHYANICLIKIDVEKLIKKFI